MARGRWACSLCTARTAAAIGFTYTKHKTPTVPLLFTQFYLAAKRFINELPAMKVHVVIRYTPWSRPLVLGCLFSVATSYMLRPPPLSLFPPLINAIQILVWRVACGV